jgi:hypothetical protein
VKEEDKMHKMGKEDKVQKVEIGCCDDW